jgi:hypothetical protein
VGLDQFLAVGCEEFEVFFSGPGRDQFTGSHAVFNVEVCAARMFW